MANGRERVDSGRAPRRQDAGGQRDDNHQEHRPDHVGGIRRDEPEEQVGDTTQPQLPEPNLQTIPPGGSRAESFWITTRGY